jgi:hypothetical protein
VRKRRDNVGIGREEEGDIAEVSVVVALTVVWKPRKNVLAMKIDLKETNTKKMRCWVVIQAIIPE